MRHLEGVFWLTAIISFILAAMTSTKSFLFVLGVLGVGSTVVAIPLHFTRAWRKLGSVPNKRMYGLWVGFETLYACGFVLCVFLAVHR